MPDRTITIPAKLDQIHSVCDVVGSNALAAGFDESEAYQCQLAVSEACENIILHGYGEGTPGHIDVSVITASQFLEIHLCDHAPPFNPAQSPEIKPWDEDDPPVGGLGLIIIHKTMDEVIYTREKERNCLIMKKQKSTDPIG
jgi:anti-sigma regulatory factor (Ser/Thr protein kinase)